MSIDDRARTLFFDQPLELALFRGRREVRVRGYQRQTPVWDENRTQREAVVTFGPFGDDVSWDSVVLFDPSGEVERQSSDVVLPVGARFRYRYVVTHG